MTIIVQNVVENWLEVIYFWYSGNLHMDVYALVDIVDDLSCI